MRTDKLSYKEVAEWYSKARNPEKGRPVQSWARMYKVGDNYELRYGGHVVGVFSPDNKFTFKLTSQQARQYSITLSQALQRAIPFIWTRKATGRYVIKPTPQYEMFKESNPDHYAWHYFSQQEGYELFEGLCFDLNTYEPTNAKPSFKNAEIDKDNKLRWLRQLRTFKQAIKVRARMGVLESLLQQVERERTGISRHDWDMPNWDSDAWQDMLYTSIRDSECSTDLLKGIIKSVSRGYYQTQISVKEVVAEADRLCTTYSLDLRRKFGVYKEPTQEITDEVPAMQDPNEVPRHTMERKQSTDTQAMVM